MPEHEPGTRRRAIQRLSQVALACLALWLLAFDACILASAPLLNGVWPRSALSLAITLQVVVWYLLWQHVSSPHASWLDDLAAFAVPKQQHPIGLVALCCAILVFCTLWLLPSAFRSGEGKPADNRLVATLNRNCLHACEATRTLTRLWQTGERPVVMPQRTATPRAAHTPCLPAQVKPSATPPATSPTLGASDAVSPQAHQGRCTAH